MTVEEELINGNNSPAVRPWVTALSLIARLVLAGVWIVSGATKVGDHLQTVVAVKAYAVVPEVMVEPIAYMLPTLEILLGVFLLLGIKNRWMAIASALVFTLFIIMIIQAWARGFQIDCGCFGGGGYDPHRQRHHVSHRVARSHFHGLRGMAGVLPQDATGSGSQQSCSPYRA